MDSSLFTRVQGYQEAFRGTVATLFENILRNVTSHHKDPLCTRERDTCFGV